MKCHRSAQYPDEVRGGVIPQTDPPLRSPSGSPGSRTAHGSRLGGSGLLGHGFPRGAAPRALSYGRPAGCDTRERAERGRGLRECLEEAGRRPVPGRHGEGRTAAAAQHEVQGQQ